ncbi:MAG: bifunctional riboflavin kinase/FAD synthetase [Magnetococcales bacterium]|nr:bifunctional riboflavin kinase/FAD synthetase [Magnetococcales bacterium]
MYVIRGRINIVPRFREAVVTIGNFDGVHRGHQAIFSRLLDLSRRHGGAPKVVITFEPHPRRFLGNDPSMARIIPLRSKIARLDGAGIDAVLILRFNRDLATLSAEQFVQRTLVAGLAVREVLVGENFRFGSGGEGNLESLRRMGRQLGFGVHGQPLMRVGDTVISSSMIRAVVGQGDLDRAGILLGRPFSMEGRVVHGERRGRAMGFPTANIPACNMLHPPLGVWIVKVWLEGVAYRGVANLGVNPTFGLGGRRLETHLFGFSGDLYRRWLRVEFLKFLRPERKFSGIDELRERIAEDVRLAKRYFADGPEV